MKISENSGSQRSIVVEDLVGVLIAIVSGTVHAELPIGRSGSGRH